MARVQSIEPNIEDLANGWLRQYGLDYKLQYTDRKIALTKQIISKGV